MKIAIVVPGRFHAFELAAALRALGHEVWVFSNYSSGYARTFGVDTRTYRWLKLSRPWMRASRWIAPGNAFASFRDRSFLTTFGRWAAGQVARHGPFDIIHAFSGVAEELLASPVRTKRTSIVRGSAHILEQRDILLAEARRNRSEAELPSDWVIERELREYEAAPSIHVLSSFARETFLRRDTDPARLELVPCGTNASQFRISEELMNGREERIARRDPMRVLCVGSFSLQKGALDFANVAAALSNQMSFTWVGDCAHDAAHLRSASFTLLPRVRQGELSAIYAEHDLFYFPTVQDGFGMVLSQALDAGMVTVASTHCAAPDLIDDGVNGFLVPPMQSTSSIELLRRLDADREELRAVLGRLRRAPRPPGWRDMAIRWLEAHGVES